jgi:hypothetical protein
MCLPEYSTETFAETHHLGICIAKFIVPEEGDIVVSVMGLLYLPASLCSLTV